MGNRAVLSFDGFSKESIGIYLHWNGGRDSVEGFLMAAREVMQGRLGDETYGRARLLQVISTFMVGNLSLGLGKCKELDCEGDNGVYVIDSATLTIKRRVNFDGPEQDVHNVKEFAVEIIQKIKAADAAAAAEI